MSHLEQHLERVRAQQEQNREEERRSANMTIDERYNRLNYDDIHALTNDHVFDAEKWLHWFKHYAALMPNVLRQMRVLIMEGTWKACRSLQYTLPDNTTVTLDQSVLHAASINSKYYFDDGTHNGQRGRPNDKQRSSANENALNALRDRFETEVLVVSGDCIEAALALKRKYNKTPMVLNMASRSNPGGGYRSGSGAQEENLHRRTNYYQCLEDSDGINQNRNWRYPLKEFGGVYSPDVTVLRGAESAGYPFLRQPELLSFVAVAAYSRPETERDTTNRTRLVSKVAKNTKRKMRAIFNIALDNNHTILVLSAFGCGAFRNPPHHIAELFAEVLTEYRGCFQCVAFAIIDDHNTGKEHNREGNIKPFCDVFQQSKPLTIGDLESSAAGVQPSTSSA